MVPAHLKPILHLKNGLDFMQGKIISYRDDMDTSEFITELYDGSTEQYLFIIPKIQEVQSDFKDYIEWPMEKMELVKVMKTPDRISCIILRYNDTLYDITPSFFKSRICYKSEVFVYKL